MSQVQYDQIVSDPEIMMGKPTIKGTRITVELILEELGEGLSVDEVLAAHPHLNREQVLAAPRFGGLPSGYHLPSDLSITTRESARSAAPGGAAAPRGRR